MKEDFKAGKHTINLTYTDRKGTPMELTFDLTPGGPGRILNAVWNGYVNVYGGLGMLLTLNDDGFHTTTRTGMTYDAEDLEELAGVLATLVDIKDDVLADVDTLENVFIGRK